MNGINSTLINGTLINGTLNSLLLLAGFPSCSRVH